MNSFVDAKDSIKCDKDYPKAYYRIGQANAALGHLKEAVDAFKSVCKLLPSDRDAREKYEATLKEFKYREMSKALSYEDKNVDINVNDITVEESY